MPRWHALYFLPDPHGHRSFRPTVATRAMGRVRVNLVVQQRVGVGFLVLWPIVGHLARHAGHLQPPQRVTASPRSDAWPAASIRINSLRRSALERGIEQRHRGVDVACTVVEAAGDDPVQTVGGDRADVFPEQSGETVEFGRIVAARGMAIPQGLGHGRPIEQLHVRPRRRRADRRRSCRARRARLRIRPAPRPTSTATPTHPRVPCRTSRDRC